jgi:hypothetical protein
VTSFCDKCAPEAVPHVETLRKWRQTGLLLAAPFSAIDALVAMLPVPDYEPDERLVRWVMAEFRHSEAAAIYSLKRGHAAGIVMTIREEDQ